MDIVGFLRSNTFHRRCTLLLLPKILRSLPFVLFESVHSTRSPPQRKEKARTIAAATAPSSSTPAAADYISSRRAAVAVALIESGPARMSQLALAVRTRRVSRRRPDEYSIKRGRRLHPHGGVFNCVYYADSQIRQNVVIQGVFHDGDGAGVEFFLGAFVGFCRSLGGYFLLRDFNGSGDAYIYVFFQILQLLRD